MPAVENILQKIITQKRAIVNERKLRLDILSLRDKINQGLAPRLRPFKKNLENSVQRNGLAIIAELKKASPSKGLFCKEYHPDKIAIDYQQHGAACLSVLTEEAFFLGSDHDLETARQSCSLPVLRKDFIIDSYQIYEARSIGADCILLIAAILSAQQLQEFYSIATNIGLEVLVEIHNETELTAALASGANLIGINNRDLKDFSINLEHTLNLAKLIPQNKLIICESGIMTKHDIQLMLEHNINIFLIGEALIKAKEPGAKLAELLG